MRKPNAVTKIPQTITIKVSDVKEIINDLDVYIVEMAWPHPVDGWQVHSMYTSFEVAKMSAKELYRSLLFDRDGCGVRLRGGSITNGGLSVTTKVLWVRMCEMPKISDVVGRPDEEDDG